MLRGLIATLAFLISITIAHAEKRVALVIGNSAYKYTRQLSNPENDAKLIASVLSDKGFEVIERTNLSYKGMKRALAEFTSKLEASGRNTVGFLFYAGHGVQIEGHNYLIPVDARIESETHVNIEGIDSASIMESLSIASNRLNVIVLDACRDNPYRSEFRSAARGLARMEAPTGSLIAYATAPGEVARDGDGVNSPYSAALAEYIAVPGLKIEEVFKRVRERVHASTSGRQTPWESSSIFGDFYIDSGSDNGPNEQAQSSSREKLLWEAIEDSSNAADLEAYIQAYPNGAFLPLARARLAALSLNVEPDSVDADISVKLQRALKTANCYGGKIDGIWGRNSRAALRRFAKSLGKELITDDASAATLQIMKQHKGSACPALPAPQRISPPPETGPRPSVNQAQLACCLRLAQNGCKCRPRAPRLCRKSLATEDCSIAIRRGHDFCTPLRQLLAGTAWSRC